MEALTESCRHADEGKALKGSRGALKEELGRIHTYESKSFDQSLTLNSGTERLEFKELESSNAEAVCFFLADSCLLC